MKIVKRILIGLAAVILVFLVVLYAGSEWVIRAGHATPEVKIAVPSDAASVEEGARLARVAGCRSCHGKDGEGTVMVDSAMLGRIAPPPLAKIAATYSNEDLVRAIRHGQRKDGSALWIMPSARSYHFIADDDLGKIIGWIRTLKPGPKDSQATMRFGPLGRGLILFGGFHSSYTATSAAAKTRPANVGQYFVDAICMDCHSLSKELPAHDGSGMVPALAPMAASYDLPNFTKLMRTGQGMSGRDLGLMRRVAANDFRYFTDAEIASLHAYLAGENAKLNGGK